MNEIVDLHAPIQRYAWGSPTAIADLLGKTPSGEPEAELWMGEHPKAPAEVEIDGMRAPLHAVIDRAPESVLGSRVRERFGGRLPFLLKVLAAGQPLSIQAHPDLDQARAGFAREEAAGIARDAPERGFRDQNHKPEVIYALTPFWVLCGFREPAEILALTERFGDSLPAREALEDGDLDTFFRAFLDQPRAEAHERVERALQHAGGQLDDPVGRWLTHLATHHPGDAGVLAPLFMHLRRLDPGEALFTGPGVLHAYLGGLGIEIMASSDNVLRGGLTVKHVDREALASVVRTESSAPDLLDAERRATETRFAGMADEFTLSRIDVAPGESFETVEDPGVEILLVTEGAARLATTRGQRRVSRGDIVLVPAAVAGYRLDGDATVFRAAVP
ncbi:MAG: mannose-6-phosphate isomerase, class I [Acidobacteriota bacterium]